MNDHDKRFMTCLKTSQKFPDHFTRNLSTFLRFSHNVFHSSLCLKVVYLVQLILLRLGGKGDWFLLNRLLLRIRNMSKDNN